MEPINYYGEKKFCPDCDEYVRYLMSPAASYCARCGSKVHLFSKQDRKTFLRSLQSEKAAGRPGRKKVS